ncbi:hypothetical protein V2J09_005855 [Rumex salicifolius]
MENFRSMSCREGNQQLESYNNNNGGTYPSNMQDLRSYSTSHASSNSYYPQNQTQLKPKKNQIQSNFESKSYNKRSATSSSRGNGWSLTDPELQRKKRVASYKGSLLSYQQHKSSRKHRNHDQAKNAGFGKCTAFSSLLTLRLSIPRIVDSMGGALRPLEIFWLIPTLASVVMRRDEGSVSLSRATASRLLDATGRLADVLGRMAPDPDSWQSNTSKLAIV